MAREDSVGRPQNASAASDDGALADTESLTGRRFASHGRHVPAPQLIQVGVFRGCVAIQSDELAASANTATPAAQSPFLGQRIAHPPKQCIGSFGRALPRLGASPQHEITEVDASAALVWGGV